MNFHTDKPKNSGVGWVNPLPQLPLNPPLLDPPLHYKKRKYNFAEYGAQQFSAEFRLYALILVIPENGRKCYGGSHQFEITVRIERTMM